ncbi:zinc ABC transporter substrate-binding protein [Bacillaceae bacterium IKA-2]|nr:zinc ABC transporter substrate-binding protein [Bacillaceae bacterium IKA-2]
MRIKFIFLAIMLVLTTFLAACGGKEEQESNNEVNGDIEEKEVLQVYTTIFPLMDFTKKIGGEYVEVKNIVPVGADAHSFEPTPQTMVDVSNAHLYIYNGAGIEGFADSVSEVLKSGSVKILKASEGIDLIEFSHGIDEHGHDEHGHEEDEHGHDEHGHEEDEHGHDEHGHEEDEHGHDEHGHEEDEHGHDEHGHEEDEHGHDEHGHEEDEHGHDEHGHEEDEHDHGEEDPHVWLDPIRSIELAENIKNTLVELMPEAADDFESNFADLKQQLEKLDEKFNAMVAEVSKDTIIVSHAGFGYWTDRYNIKQIGISGISPTNEPSIRQLTEIIEYAEAQGINHIMFEQNIPTNISETVRSQVGAEALWLHNLEVLVQDDIDNNEDYFSLMERNIEALQIALQ